MKRSTGATTAILLLLLLAAPETTHGQEEGMIYVQAGGTYNMATGKFSDTGGRLDPLPETGYSDAGYGMTVSLVFAASPTISLFGEWYRPTFDTDRAALLQALGIPTTVPFDLKYAVTMTGVGIRLNVYKSTHFNPYLTLGLGRYRAEIRQEVYDTTTIDRTDVTSGINLGGGISVPVGSFSIEVGARYHSAQFVTEGQELDWPATWLETRIMFSYGFSR
jgi:hypothetical protein